MRAVFVTIVLLFGVNLFSFAQNELSRLRYETLWYEYEDEVSSGSLIMATKSSPAAIEAGLNNGNYDGIAIVSISDYVSDDTTAITLGYRIRTSEGRVDLIHPRTGAIPFYVKFRQGRAYLYSCDDVTRGGSYSLLFMMQEFDYKSVLSNR